MNGGGGGGGRQLKLMSFWLSVPTLLKIIIGSCYTSWIGM